LKRLEMGVAVNNSTVQLPGYWQGPPKIMVSPAILDVYQADYPNQSQKLDCRAMNVTEVSAGVYEFVPYAELQLSAGEGGVLPGFSRSANNSGSSVSTTWTSPVHTTAPNTEQITFNMSFSLSGQSAGCTVDKHAQRYGDCISCSTSSGSISIDIYVYIDGTEYNVYSYDGTGSASNSISETFNVSSGEHDIYVKASVYAEGDYASCDDHSATGTGSASFSWDSYSTNIESATTVAEGTLNWIAIGE